MHTPLDLPDPPDPVIALFGKDVASIVYRCLYQLMIADVIAEYHQRRMKELCPTPDCICVRFKRDNDRYANAYNYRGVNLFHFSAIDIGRGRRRSLPKNYWTIECLY